MAQLTLSFVTGPNERVSPLVKGVVQPEGVELIPMLSDPSETFWRQRNFEEFDISEMSLSSYLIARSRGMDMMAIPVFPSRRFMHAQLSCHADSGISRPEDISGKRIGVGEYQQTAALWTRGILEHDFGVSQYGVHWFMERTDELSHGGATGFTPPEGISFQRVPPDKSLASMLVANEIDVAAVDRAFQKGSNIIDRSTRIRAREGDWSRIKPLFPDRIARASGSSSSTATSRPTTPTSSGATSTESTPGSRSISTRPSSRPRKWPGNSCPQASRRRWCSGRSIWRRRGRYSVTIPIRTEYATTGRC